MRCLPALTIFLGSFLLFLLEPLIGRTLLPAFGGSSSVWITCLVVYQVLLVVGYGYAFLPARPSRLFKSVHLFLLVASTGLLFLASQGRSALLAWSSQLSPVTGVVVCVLALAGFAFIVLSANTTVVQSLCAEQGKSVYRLYALSNAGSLCGLLFYPVIVEPFVSLTMQWNIFATVMLIYVCLVASLAFRNKPVHKILAAEESVDMPSEVGWCTHILWFIIPLMSTAILTAVTTYVTTEIMPLPIVWCILLALFLASYMIGFTAIGELLLPVWVGLAPCVLAFAAWAWWPRRDPVLRFIMGGGAAITLLTIVCTALHAWLCRIRPSTKRLPLYYFLGTLGGAVGGMCVGVLAPAIFSGIHEYPLLLLCVAMLLTVLVWRVDFGTVPQAKSVLLLILGFVPYLLFQGVQQRATATGDECFRQRGFYGVVTVNRLSLPMQKLGNTEMTLMQNGQTLHGSQPRKPPYDREPTMYYAANGGGIAFSAFGLREAGHPLHVGAIGLGAGVIAAWGEKGDRFRFYEISPECVAAATNTALFTYLSNSKADVEIVAADARIALEREKSSLIGTNAFDILIVDAYSGDAVPLHLITRQAFELYTSVLKDDGILALHLSNWHVDLWPVVKSLAKAIGWTLYGTYSKGGTNPLAVETGWAFLSRKTRQVKLPFECREIDWESISEQTPLTDDRGGLLFNLRFAVSPPVK